jgi:hypothetical protein
MLHCRFRQAKNIERFVIKPYADYDISSPSSKHLQEAKIISSIHKNTHPAKYARCLFKLSEALRQVPGREVEANQQLREAEGLYCQITGKPPSTTGEEEYFDALIHISQR